MTGRPHERIRWPNHAESNRVEAFDAADHIRACWPEGAEVIRQVEALERAAGRTPVLSLRLEKLAYYIDARAMYIKFALNEAKQGKTQ